MNITRKTGVNPSFSEYSAYGLEDVDYRKILKKIWMKESYEIYRFMNSLLNKNGQKN